MYRYADICNNEMTDAKITRDDYNNLIDDTHTDTIVIVQITLVMVLRTVVCRRYR